MFQARRWQMRGGNGEPARPSEVAVELATRLKTSPLIGQILVNRGFSQPQDADGFLRPSLKNLIEPSLLPGLPAASGRIARAIRDGEQIVIYGDYDVDGITATSMLWHAITILGGRVRTYIPHRIEEGYGLNAEALRQIIEDGAQLVVTVDCGITAVEPARVAKERGVDLIITDHHDWHGEAGSGLPDCFGIVHPRISEGYPNPFLCGAGVAFKLAWGIGKAVAGADRVGEIFREFLIEATALAALGTIADVVPLVGENRVLAHFGLGGLRQSKLTGIQALIESASLTGQKLDSYDVGFKLAPRLNACGRMGHAALAVEMLTTATPERAGEIATFLEDQNRDRQAMERKILGQAMDRIESSGWVGEDSRALVVDGEGWHAGVIGIVAARIVDRLCRPTVVISYSNGHGQGSARSISGFHLARALEKCHDCLLSHGGHEMAAGLKIETAKIDDFRRAFRDFAATTVTKEMLSPRLELECVADIGQISEAVVRDLHRVGPFGQGNPRPLLCITGVTIAAVPRRVGKSGDHLQLHVRQGDRPIKCIAFGAGELFDRLTPGTVVDLAVEPQINEFAGRISVELGIRDFRFDAENTSRASAPR